MLEGLAGAVDDVTLGIESDRCLLDPQFELRVLIGYVDMFLYVKHLFRTVFKGQNEQVGGRKVRVQKYYEIVRLP